MKQLLQVTNNTTKEVYFGRSSAEVVRGMMAHGWFEGDMKHEYMESVARRVHFMYGHDIRATHPRDFLADLEKHGLVTINTLRVVA